METLIGFVVGYLVGTREGKGGLERLKASVSAILSSDEVRSLAGQAMAAAEPVVRRGGFGGIGGSVVRQVVSRAAGARENSRAA